MHGCQPPSPIGRGPAGQSWGLELPSGARFPGWKLASAAGSRSSPPPARLLACSQHMRERKVLRTPNGRPPPVPSARPFRHDPAKPQQLRAHPSICSARRDQPPGRSGIAPAPRAAVLPEWRGRGLERARKRVLWKSPWARREAVSGPTI